MPQSHPKYTPRYGWVDHQTLLRHAIRWQFDNNVSHIRWLFSKVSRWETSKVEVCNVGIQSLCAALLGLLRMLLAPLVRQRLEPWVRTLGHQLVNQHHPLMIWRVEVALCCVNFWTLNLFRRIVNHLSLSSSRFDLEHFREVPEWQ